MRPDSSDTIAAVFERRAAEFADRVAISAPAAELTYAELNIRADRLAAHLRELGVQPDDPVGVDLPRSADLIVALLAVVKVGAGYLALDPYQPEDVRSTILADAGVKVIVTPEVIAEMPAAAGPSPTDTSSGESIAYFAYTSGSTGRPKGVCVPHRAVLRLITNQPSLPIDGDDVFLQLAPVAFDASTLEIWGPLLNGARLVVAPPEELSPTALARLVSRAGVTVLWLTAGLFHTVVDAGIGRLKGLRYLVAGGDVLSADHVNRALRALPGTTLVNGYGPTENTTFTACHPITEPLDGDRVPIGYPIRGTTVHLLTEDLAPTPDGEVGELFAAGAGLALGYRNDPALTAARFIPNPFSRTPGDRLYRTGDLARRRPDGVLEFHGRTDGQVKIRGFRVETGQVEIALRGHPEVFDAAVVARGDDGDRVLSAFYLSDLPLVSADLRTHLAELLPQYMIPATFQRLERLPLTGNGKVDRTALAAIAAPQRPELSTDYRAPGGATETWLAQLWADLMHVDRVGVDDDFFELGGHSLMATRITVEIGERFGRTVSAVTFYEEPTIARLAELIERAAADDIVEDRR
ncbi:non-ribosomal peptide synthetase [Nocardia terpenica]|uniref:Thioester reductase n=1 Tax=Nocardia terpenica TaxID=455432 RepID=A0A291RIA9_9NOCA|nr:non-ribosomal peptide synthetase [Nocardia terpenica]ATL66812.1 thioester reductase [Nocardia terpenica]